MHKLTVVLAAVSLPLTACATTGHSTASNATAGAALGAAAGAGLAAATGGSLLVGAAVGAAAMTATAATASARVSRRSFTCCSLLADSSGDGQVTGTTVPNTVWWMSGWRRGHRPREVGIELVDRQPGLLPVEPGRERVSEGGAAHASSVAQGHRSVPGPCGKVRRKALT